MHFWFPITRRIVPQVWHYNYAVGWLLTWSREALRIATRREWRARRMIQCKPEHQWHRTAPPEYYSGFV